MPLLDANFLNCFYFFLLMVGVFYAIFAMISGGLHAIHIPAVHFDLGDVHLGGAHVPGADFAGPHIDTGGDLSGHDLKLLSLSPIAMATFITSFGAIGLIAIHGFGASAELSLVWAVIGAIIFAVGSHFLFFYFFIAPQASSAVRTGTLIGTTAEVTVPIPGNSVGEIAYVAMGERHTSTARSADNKDIPRGAVVMIEGLAGTVMLVRIVTSPT